MTSHDLSFMLRNKYYWTQKLDYFIPAKVIGKRYNNTRWTLREYYCNLAWAIIA